MGSYQKKLPGALFVGILNLKVVYLSQVPNPMAGVIRMINIGICKSRKLRPASIVKLIPL